MNKLRKIHAIAYFPLPTDHRPLTSASNSQFSICNLQFAIKRLLFLVGLIFLWTSSFPALAQDYLFGVPKLTMYVTVQPDASVKIDYEIQFHNQPGAHSIDIVDIGTPNAGYRLGDIRAWIENQPATDIRSSTEVHPGFEVHLDRGTIAPGGTGTLRVVFTVPGEFYQDTTRKDYASMRITPTWFDGTYITGNTHIQVAIQLPKNVKPDEALYQNVPFTNKALTKQGVVVYWDFPTERLAGPHMVAVSFPKGDMKVIRQSALDLLLKWFSESQEARIVCGLIFLVLFTIMFFRFSGGTGFSVFFILSALACFSFYLSPGWHLISLPLVVVLIGLNEWLLGKRKIHYMPPIAQVEGGGIKRGLTAPEAAVLLELPISKVLSLVIFGMLKKGVLRQLSADPLSVAIDEAFKLKSDDLLTDEKARTQFYRDAGQKKGTVVHAYEQPFIFLLEKNPGKPVKEIDFGLPVRELINGAAARMAGFNLRETQDYYRSIIKRAAEQAAAIGDIPQREATVDRNFEWILMDDNYPTVFTGWPYRPIWTRGSTMSMPGVPAAPSSTPSIPGQTTFKDVASSFSGWAENTMGNMASAIGPGSLSDAKSAGGFLDLSGADHVTGDIFSALAEASSHGGGGGGGGCACAGCACACACAGGGR